MNLTTQIKHQARKLCFDQVRVSDIDLQTAQKRLDAWLDANYHGTMDYMSAHGIKRTHPELILENCQSVICVALNYAHQSPSQMEQILQNPKYAYISRYALGRDYHKVMRNKLRKLFALSKILTTLLAHVLFVIRHLLWKRHLLKNAE